MAATASTSTSTAAVGKGCIKRRAWRCRNAIARGRGGFLRNRGIAIYARGEVFRTGGTGFRVLGFYGRGDYSLALVGCSIRCLVFSRRAKPAVTAKMKPGALFSRIRKIESRAENTVALKICSCFTTVSRLRESDYYQRTACRAKIYAMDNPR